MAGLNSVDSSANSNLASSAYSAQSSGRVESAIDAIESRLDERWNDWDVSNQDLMEINQILAPLTATEKSRVIAGLSDNSLQKWGSELDGTVGGLSRDELTDVYTGLASDLNADQLARVYASFGSDHQPGLTSAINSHADSATRVEFVEQVQQQALAHTEVPSGLTAEEQALYLDLAQMALDVVGIVEPTPFADGANTVISLFRGDWLGAGLSAVGMIPYLGDAAKLGKLGKWAETMANVVEVAAKNADFAKAIEPVLKRIDDAIAAVPDSVMSKLPRSVQDTLSNTRSKIDELLHGGDVATIGGRVRRFDNLDDFNRAANNAAPNTTYEFGNYTWKTDSQGRVVEASGKVDLTRADGRSGTDGVGTTEIGKEGQAGDIGFHLIGDQFNGPTNRLNVVPGNGVRVDPNGPPNLNQGQYAKFENAVKKALEDPANVGKDVEIRITPQYRRTNDSARPDQFEASYRVEGGDWQNFVFKNKQGG